ncbi:hypothetical protein Tco_0455921 [Tanacetum coccineum]
MGRDTIQLEDAVSTIFGEYLLEFTSEYGILEGLHPEFPGPEDTIVDFSEGKVSVYTKFFKFANYRIPLSQFLFDILRYYQIHLSQLSVIGAAKVSHFEITCRILNIIPTLNLFCVFYIPSYNSGWMSFSKRPGKNTPQCYTKPLDSLKNWNNRFFWVDERIFPTVVAWRTSALKDGMPLADSYSSVDVTTLDTRRTPIQKQPEVLLCLVGLSQNYFLGDDVYPTFLYDDDRVLRIQRRTEGLVQDEWSREIPSAGHATTAEVALEAGLEKEVRKLDQEVKSLRDTITEVHGLCNQTKNLETLLEAEADMKKVAKAKNAKLTKELESLHVWFSNLQVNNNQLSQQVSNLQAQITGEEKIKAVFEGFNKYEDVRVEQRCAEMDARLDALSIDFDEELYPHMLTVIAGHRWVIGHGIRLAVMKCAESTELRLKDAPIELIMSSLHLEGDTGEDAPQRVRDLRPSSSQLKIPVYPEVRNPKDPWAVKEEMMLKDVIAANISLAKKKKKCMVVCRTHGIGTAHHARSDGIPVSVPTVAPQGLAILLVDAATQTEVSEGEASPRLLRSKSLSPMYNLDWS